MKVSNFFFVKSSHSFYEQLFRPVIMYFCQLSTFRSILEDIYTRMSRRDIRRRRRFQKRLFDSANASFHRYCDDLINEYAIDFLWPTKQELQRKLFVTKSLLFYLSLLINDTRQRNQFFKWHNSSRCKSFRLSRCDK